MIEGRQGTLADRSAYQELAMACRVAGIAQHLKGAVAIMGAPNSHPFTWQMAE
jgi:hypothetical protein